MLEQVIRAAVEQRLAALMPSELPSIQSVAYDPETQVVSVSITVPQIVPFISININVNNGPSLEELTEQLLSSPGFAAREV